MTCKMKVVAGQVFDGESAELVLNQTILLVNGIIAEIRPTVAADIESYDTVRSPIVVPGFIDLQINGAGDVLFNDTPDVDTLCIMVAAARKGGTAHILPTFITAPNRRFKIALASVKAAIEERIPGILGIHLEGPFLSPNRLGIHPPDCIRPIEPSDLNVLVDTFPGAKLITLAPEEDTIGAVKVLSDADWTVFAGHSDATCAQIHAAQQQGLSGATHLFNAMSQIQVREPGVAGAIIGGDILFAGIIADGHHVHKANISLAFRSMGPRRLLLVTDAMPSLAGKKNTFYLSGKKIFLDGGRLVDATGTLAGAHLAMDEAVRNIVDFLGINLSDAFRMASTTPADAIGLGGELGRVRPGYRASLTLLDNSIRSLGVIVDGKYFNRDAKQIPSREIVR